ncbi:hypothetical protein ACOSP7_013096 [Xanthoceras sorbifolium]
MSSLVEEAIQEIELEKESSGESMNSKPHPLATNCTQFNHSVDPAKRSWKTLLSKESLRSSRLWAQVDLNVKGTHFPKLKNLVSYAWVRHCFELLCGTRFLTPVSEVEHKFASNSMSNIKSKIMYADEAFARRRERALASAQKRKQPSELKKRKVERKKDKKLEELEKRVAVLTANEV